MTFLIQGNTVAETWSQSTDKRTTRFCREKERAEGDEREGREGRERRELNLSLHFVVQN